MKRKSSNQIVRFYNRFLPIALMLLNYVVFTVRKKVNTLKCSFGNVECSFDNRVKMFPTKLRYSFAPIPRTYL